MGITSTNICSGAKKICYLLKTPAREAKKFLANIG